MVAQFASSNHKVLLRNFILFLPLVFEFCIATAVHFFLLEPPTTPHFTSHKLYPLIFVIVLAYCEGQNRKQGLPCIIHVFLECFFFLGSVSWFFQEVVYCTGINNADSHWIISGDILNSPLLFLCVSPSAEFYFKPIEIPSSLLSLFSWLDISEIIFGSFYSVKAVCMSMELTLAFNFKYRRDSPELMVCIYSRRNRYKNNKTIR